MGTIIQIPDVSERDIDLLLLEECIASVDFRSWFLEQMGIENVASLSEASRSVKTDSGESDLELTLQGGAGVVKVLVENKIDAVFQPTQPQRYATRAQEYRRSGKYKDVVTVVIAPEVYFGDESESYGFDAKITYENILHWFSAPEHQNPRMEYKRALLRVAITRGRTGWQHVPDPHVGQFWQKYWQLANQIAPQLSMPVPKKEIPAGSHFIVFQPAALPTNIKLKHKVRYGNVDLEFRGMGTRIAELDRLYRTTLPSPIQIERAAKSAVLRARVAPVDMTRVDFASSAPAIRQGIEAAARLLDWYIKRHQ